MRRQSAPWTHSLVRFIQSGESRTRRETRCFIVTASPSVVVVVCRRVRQSSRIATERGREATEVFHPREREREREVGQCEAVALSLKGKKEKKEKRETGPSRRRFSVDR